MKSINISIVVKTFLRPNCLENLLHSIHTYQIVYGYKFKDVIIIDDSDEYYQTKNNTVIKKYKSKINIIYKFYPYNSLGTSRGRNIGVSIVQTPFFILCDDDNIFDTSCNIENCINIISKYNIDILGGFYKNIKNIEDKHYDISNWIGFYTDGYLPTIQIFTDYFPDLKKCTIVKNFFIAKTEVFNKIYWNENLKTNEHNEFFF